MMVLFKNIEKIEEHIIMQFGRIDEHLFNMDIASPISIFQGFAIALSSFDYKYLLLLLR
jgi:hypothetical protein